MTSSYNSPPRSPRKWPVGPVLLVASALLLTLVSLVPVVQQAAQAVGNAAGLQAWYLVRGSGLLAYYLIWAATVAGLLVSGRRLKRPERVQRMTDWHTSLTLGGLYVALFHALLLLADRYIGFTAAQVFVPFWGKYHPVLMAMGSLGLYLALFLIVTSLLRFRIGFALWRRLHLLSFPLYLLLTLHAGMLGTDAGNNIAQWAMWLAGFVVIALTLERFNARFKERPEEEDEDPEEG